MTHKQIIHTSIIILSSILLIFLFYPAAKKIPAIVTETNKPQLSRMQNGYLFSVAIDNRDHYIAKKISKNQYELLYVNQHEKLSLCQKVHTTGLDQQFPEDIPVGYIIRIDNTDNDIYQTVYVGHSSKCIVD